MTVKIGAGDRDRTGDIQLGKPQETIRPMEIQADTWGTVRQNEALLARIEHDYEHKNLKIRKS